MIKKEIFRSYDIRGIFGSDLTEEVAYIIGKSIGTKCKSINQNSIHVGFDGRTHSPILANSLMKGLIDCGLIVYNLKMVPTPVTYFANFTKEVKNSIMITGSHNPSQYNGFKIVLNQEVLSDDQIMEFYNIIKENKFASGLGEIIEMNILDEYHNYLKENIKIQKPLKVVLDCGNGVEGIIAPKVLKSFNLDVISIFEEVDGNFPNHHPDPSDFNNLKDLIQKVKENNADIGLAFDGDGDRVGVVTNLGNYIPADKILLFLSEFILKEQKGTIIYDVKCSLVLKKQIQKFNGKSVMWKTGHSLIKKKMKEENAVLGGEMSGHIFFKHRWFGFDDGLYSALRILEILSQNDKTIEQLISKYPKTLITPEISLKTTEEEKFKIIEELKKAKWIENAIINFIDGIRVDTDFGFGLIRASNTSPILVLRFEADNEQNLNKLKYLFKSNLSKINLKLANQL